MLKKRKGEAIAILTLGLVLIGGIITLGASFFINNQKANFASNSRAAACPEVFECKSIKPPICRKKNYDSRCQFTNYSDVDISNCAGKPCNRGGLPVISTATPISTITPISDQFISGITITPTPTKSQILPIQETSCIFNAPKACPKGTAQVSYQGYCGCVSENPTLMSTLTPTPTQIITNRRCVELNTWPIFNHPARVEELINGRWKTVEECISPKTVCNPISFQCTAIIPTGPKQLGESCQSGSECQTGECSLRYTSPWGEDTLLFRKKCVYSIAEQIKFVEKKGKRDFETVKSLAAVAVLTSPLVTDTFSIAAKYGIPAAANFLFQALQQPGAQNALATINIATTLYATSDCIQNGPSGQWCSMLAALISNNTGQFSQAFTDDLNTLSRNLSNSLNVGRYLNLSKNATEKIFATDDIVMANQDTFLGFDADTVIPYQPKPIINSNRPWPVGQTFPSNRGGYVVIDEMIGSGGFGNVYKATLFEPNLPPKTVVIKFPQTLSPDEVVLQASEQYLLTKAQNSLPEDLRLHLSKPYGFATVQTSIGEVQFPIMENFGPGQTLSSLIRNSLARQVYLSKSQVDALYKIARRLDGQSIFFRDIFTNNIYVADDGNLIFFDPFQPRFNQSTGNYLSKTSRFYTPEDVSKFQLDRQLLSLERLEDAPSLSMWMFEVPTGNVAALNKMFQLFNNVIVVK